MKFRASFPNKRFLGRDEVADMLRTGPKLEWFNGPYTQGVIIGPHRYALVREFDDGTLEVEGYDTEGELGIALWLQHNRARYTDVQAKRGYWVSYYVEPEPPQLVVEVEEDEPEVAE